MQTVKNGTIRKLSLTNFQTYERATFTFSPVLNFIAGPNGSGKSSIANAIALAFGGTPKTIGKTKDSSEYIRFDASEASIEVEIYYDSENCVNNSNHTKKYNNEANASYPVQQVNGENTRDGFRRPTAFIKRIIRKGQNLWFINNRPVKKAEYAAFMQNLAVKVDNLCQFLPQEKVSEFSRLTPEELLNETLEALDRTDILEMKAELNANEKKMVELEVSLKCIEKSKEGMEVVLQNIERGVEKIREKEKMEARIELMEKKRWWVNYKLKQNAYVKAKNTCNKVNNEIKLKKNEVLKIDEEIKRLSSTGPSQQLNRMVENMNKHNKSLEKNVDELKRLKKIEEMLEVDLRSMNSTRKKKEEGIKSLEVEIEDKKEELSKISIEEMPELDMTTKNELEPKILDLKRRQGQIAFSSSEIQLRMNQLQVMKSNLHETHKRRLEMLHRYHNDTYLAVLWLRKHKHSFKKEIIEPLYLTISLKDRSYALEVENFLQFSTLTSFICQDSEDFEKFSKTCKDEKRWSINVVEMVREVPKPKYTSDDVKSAGFSGLLTDFIEVRKEVRDFLCVYGHFHAIPITKKNINEIEVLKKYEFRKMAKNGRYIEIKHSKYNKGDYTIVDNALNGKGIFSSDFSKIEMEKIDIELIELDIERKANEVTLKKLYSEHEEIEVLLRQEYQRHSAIRAKISEINNMTMKKDMLTSKIEQHILELERASDFSEIDSQISVKISEKNKAYEVYNKFTETFCKDLKNEEYYSSFTQAVKLTQKMRDFFSQISKLESHKDVVNQEISRIEQDLLELNACKDKSKEAVQKLKNEASKYKLSDEDQDDFKELPESIQLLDEEIAKQKTMLIFCNVDNKIIDEHEAKSRELDALVRRLNMHGTSKRRLEGIISELKGKVIECISGIIDKISEIFTDLFMKFNCEGKVLFSDTEMDSTKWKLNIMVKFRENENLEVLSSFRQSGGEKSVSTILYLLSLQRFTHAPFRLVDEINQGMDVYNERLMHDILVTLSEEENAVQFFIITPKIVSGLRYSKAMKVIILYTGRFDFDSFAFADCKSALLS